MSLPRKIEKSKRPYRFLVFSFDDSVTQDIRFTKLLEKHGFRGTFHLNSGLFGIKNTIGPPEKRVPHDRLEASLIREVYKNHESAGHTKTHPALDMLSKEEIIDEVEADIRAIEALTGEKVIGMAYPGDNRFNDFVAETIGENTVCIYARTARFTHGVRMPDANTLLTLDPSVHIFDGDLLPLAEKMSKSGSEEDLCLIIAGHSYELDITEKWDEIDVLFGKLASLANITNITMGELALYLKGE
ncbi:MAG: polysaccharide deacetylase family protein [Clostridia bacterium]|nr:polysaccharide deacetylase family protein [Clostridia bacterium]